MKREKEIEAFLKGELPSEEKLKYEIARELGESGDAALSENTGVLDQVIERGWKSLSAKETGRIGGLMTKRRKNQ